MPRFEYSDEKSHKFWEISVDGNEISVLYGRIGTNGQPHHKAFATAEAADKEVQKLIAQKLAKGYQSVDGDASEVARSVAAKKRTEVTPLSKVELEVMAELLQEAAENHVDHSCTDYWLANDPIAARFVSVCEKFSRTHDEYDTYTVSEDDEHIPTFDFAVLAYLAARCDVSSKIPLTKLELEELNNVFVMLAENQFNEYERLSQPADWSLPVGQETRALAVTIVQFKKKQKTLAWLENIEKATASIELHKLLAFPYFASRCKSLISSAISAKSPEIIERKVDRDSATVPTLGIYKSWKSEAFLLKTSTDNVKHFESFRSRDFVILNDLLEGRVRVRTAWPAGVRETAYPPNRYFDALFGYSQVFKAQTGALMFNRTSPEIWSEPYKKYLAYLLTTNGDIRIGPLSGSVDALAHCLALGWIDQAKWITESIHERYKNRRASDLQNCDLAKPLRFWLFRTALDHWGLDAPIWQEMSYKKDGRDAINPFAKGQRLSAPALNKLYDRWRDRDIEDLRPYLLWLADYYTHQTRQDTTIYEIGSWDLETRYPALIIAWYRLRELHGLTTPEIDHPLMTASYSKLMPRQDVYTDDLLRLTVAKMRS